jgi:hypothetical protein
MKTLTNTELYFGILFAFLAIISLNLWRMWLRNDRKRLIIADELISSETTSRRAKRVMFPLFLIYFLDFIAFMIRCGLTRFAGFESVMPEVGGYSFVEHGHTYHITPGEFWLGRIQAVVLIFSFVALFIARTYFLHSGDLKRNKSAA